MARVYKEDSPINTVHKIRSILSNLDYFVYESFWGAPYQNTFSVRVQADDDSGAFGTNGKGRTMQFALASAYAEYAERLQNGFLAGGNSFNRFFLNQIKDRSGIVYFPDEKVLKKDEFRQLPEAILKDILRGIPTEAEVDRYYDRANHNGYDGILSIPFYDVKNKRVQYIPYNLLLMHTGSNGMAAGNSIYEASFQALCELCERYASAQIFNKRLTPPTIPVSYLKEHCPKEYGMICDIERSGLFKVTVKDFSAGEGLPSIGVIIRSRDDKKYKLNIGSDTSLPVALGRALTEIYQGYEDEAGFQKRMLDLATEERPFFLSSDPQCVKERALQLSKFTKDGSGYFPISIFGDEPSYEFSPEVFTPAESYREDAIRLVRYFLNSGREVYMRNSSFLGFPTVYIYVPYVSGLGRKNIPGKLESGLLEAQIETDHIEDIFFPTNTWDDDKIRSLIHLLDIDEGEVRSPKLLMEELLKLEFKSKTPWHSVPVNFFLLGFACVVKEYQKARRYLDEFTRATNTTEVPYYKNLDVYLECKANGKDPKERLDARVIEELESGIKDIKSVFKQINLPSCPDCENCPLNKDCMTKNLLEKTITLNKTMMATKLDQFGSFSDFSS